MRLKSRIIKSRRKPHTYSRRRKRTARGAVLRRWLYTAVVWAVIGLAGVLAWQWAFAKQKIDASPETVAALRVPHRAIGLLHTYAIRHGIPFAELFVLFCAENGFFPQKHAAYDLSGLERQYVQDFNAIKRRYNAKKLEPYVTMFEQIFDELVCFPIPDGWDDDPQTSFMYGDSWQPTRPGTDILDRENIRGRIPIVSMTDGVVQDAGYSDTRGYHIGIVTLHGTYYLYAHLDSFAPGIAPGTAVRAGQSLGSMGSSGSIKGNAALPVHLHIGISPITGFAKNRIWLNPYPLLRYIE